MATPHRPSRLLGLVAACWCLTSSSLPAWSAPAVPEKGSPLRLICVEDGECGPSKASDAIPTAAYVFGGLTSALFFFTDGASYRIAPEALIGHLAAWGLDGLSVFATKRAVGRARPYTYSARYPGAYSQDDIDDSSHSFYSAHTSQTATVLFSAATTFTLYHRKGLRRTILSPVLYAIALAATIAVGELRVRTGKHFYSDVITGGVMGTLWGVGIPLASHFVGRLIREKRRRKVGLSILPTSAGLQVLGWF